jgi:hypothetical protein
VKKEQKGEITLILRKKGSEEEYLENLKKFLVDPTLKEINGPNGSISLETARCIVYEWINQITKKELLLIKDVDPNRLTQQILKKNYDISPSRIRRTGPLHPIIKCPCGNIIHIIQSPRNRQKKYCCHRCRLDAINQRRNERKNIQKSITTQKECIICHKPMNKRSGAKTCSAYCRKALSLNRKML